MKAAYRFDCVVSAAGYTVVMASFGLALISITAFRTLTSIW